ncbi:hypothetical protein VTO42DRAFT_4051 [Malbranchea cinnamomea]
MLSHFVAVFFFASSSRSRLFNPNDPQQSSFQTTATATAIERVLLFLPSYGAENKDNKVWLDIVGRLLSIVALEEHLSRQSTMPYATHWVCCKCGFGPMLIENYPACLNCQHRGAKSSCCTHASLGMEAARVERVSCYSPTRNSVLRGSPEALEHDAIANVYSSPVSHIMDSPYPIRGRPTDLYICCSCGDGPKVYQHHARCVMCNHDACQYCTHVK